MKTAIIAFILLVLPLASVLGLSWLGADTGLLLLLNAQQDSGPSPLLYTLGLSMPIWQPEHGFLWEAGYHLFGTFYQFASGTASPVELEAADSLWTLGLAVESSLGYRFRLGEKMSLGTAFCLAGVFRLPLVPVGDGASFWRDAFKYLMARFLFTGLELQLGWKVQERLTLIGSLEGLYPFFLVWDKVKIASWDQIIVRGILSLRFSLPQEE